MDTIQLSDPPIEVRLRLNARARRFTLRLDPSGEGAVLTVPPGVPKREVQSFLDRHADWLRSAKAKHPGTIVIEDSAKVPVDGRLRTVVVLPGPRRAPRLDKDRIIVQGPGAPGPRLAVWMKARARDVLAPSVHRYATALGRSISRVALRDTRSRWGSCSTSGTVSFSWRLAMAPVDVQDYVAAHEAAHLVEMNHSPAYWAIVSQLCPDYQTWRAWLRREGRALHRYCFDG